MADLARIKRNVRRMAELGAPEADIDGYITSEGVTVDDVRNFREMGMAEDVARSGATGLRQGVEGGLGAFGDAANMTGDIAGWAAGKLGFGQTGQDWARTIGRRMNPAGFLPTTAEIQTGTKGVVGEHYQPQTLAGEYARTIGEFAPAAVAGPGGVARKTAMAVVPAVASETAGQITKGTAAEPYARALGGIAAGFAAAGRPRVAPSANVPTAADIKAGGRALYNAADMQAVGVKPGALKKALANTQIKLRDFAFDPDLQPDTATILKRMVSASKSKGMSLAELENLRKKAVNVVRDAQRPSDREAVSTIIDQLDTMMDDLGNFAPGKGQNLTALKEARETWKRARKTEVIEQAVDRAQNQATGFENGLVVQFRQIANNPKRMRQFTKAEQDMIRSVVRRASPHGVMRALGMLAPNSTFGGIASGSLLLGQGVVPGLVSAGVGYGARKGAESLTRGKVGQLQQAVATGQTPQAPRLNVDAFIRNLLAAEASIQSAKNPAMLAPPVR